MFVLYASVWRGPPLTSVMEGVGSLHPQGVWEEFLHICSVPHCSGNTAAMRAALRRRAAAHGLECIEDGEPGNLLIVKRADPGFESSPTVCLQAHMDMVAAKDPDVVHDFLTDPIRPQIKILNGK